MSRRHLIALSLFAATLTGASARAQIVHTPVFGDIELEIAEIECPSEPSACFFCVNDVDDPGDHRLIIALGQRLPWIPVWANAQGFVRPFVEIDGVHVPPSLLPTGSFFRSGLYWLDRFIPPSCSGDVPPGVVRRHHAEAVTNEV